MTDDPTLLPCPFCGGEAEFVDCIPLDVDQWVEVTCIECGGSVGTQNDVVLMPETREEAARRWNRRVAKE